MPLPTLASSDIAANKTHCLILAPNCQIFTPWVVAKETASFTLYPPDVRNYRGIGSACSLPCAAGEGEVGGSSPW